MRNDVKPFTPQLNLCCLLCRYLPAHSFIQMLNTPKLGCHIFLANCFKDNIVCGGLVWALAFAPPKFDESSVSSSASHLSHELASNGGISKIPVIVVFLSSTASWNIFVGWLMGGLTCALEEGPGAAERGPGGGVELDDAGKMTGLFRGCAGGTLGVPTDDSHCAENCGWGNF